MRVNLICVLLNLAPETQIEMRDWTVEHFPERPPRLGPGAVVRALVVHDGQHGDLLGRREEVVEEVDVQDGAQEHGVVVEEGEGA